MPQLEEPNLQVLSNQISFDNLSKKEKIIFLSGVFDGEGSLGYWSSGKGKKRRLVAKVETTDADMVARFKEVFGGDFFANQKREVHYKNSFTWKVVREQAWKALEQMIPYMCLRRREKFYGLVELIGDGSKDRSSHLQKQTRIKEAHVRRTETTCTKDGSR